MVAARNGARSIAPCIAGCACTAAATLLAATAAWTSLADGDGDAALPLAGGDRYAHAAAARKPRSTGLRAEPLVASDPATATRPFVLDAANRFYLWRNYQQEREAAALIRARRANAAAPSADAEADSKPISMRCSTATAAPNVDAQRHAVRAVAGRRLFVLTGGPGTGKTTTVLRMLLMLQRRAPAPLSIRIAAPTGKAAQRLVAGAAARQARRCATTRRRRCLRSGCRCSMRSRMPMR